MAPTTSSWHCHAFAVGGGLFGGIPGLDKNINPCLSWQTCTQRQFAFCPSPPSDPFFNGAWIHGTKTTHLRSYGAMTK